MLAWHIKDTHAKRISMRPRLFVSAYSLIPPMLTKVQTGRHIVRNIIQNHRIMKQQHTNSIWRILPIVCLIAMATLTAKAQVIHIDVSGGLQYFPGMTKKIGWDYNLGGRLMVTDNWFAAALIHGGFDHGHYTGIYANEEKQLKHNREAFFLGLGAGYLRPINDHLHANLQLLGGWGSVETVGNPEQKVVNDIEQKLFKGFSAAAVIGLDYYLPSAGIWGVNITTQYIDGHLLPSINLKYGINFIL